MQLPPEQRWPAPQLPVAHTPPQPSGAPHGLPTQFGTHTHAPPVPHRVPPGQETQPAPPAPQVSSVLPA